MCALIICQRHLNIPILSIFIILVSVMTYLATCLQLGFRHELDNISPLSCCVPHDILSLNLSGIALYCSLSAFCFIAFIIYVFFRIMLGMLKQQLVKSE